MPYHVLYCSSLGQDRNWLFKITRLLRWVSTSVMWKAVSLRDPVKRLPFLNVKRCFRKTCLGYNWLLNNDLIRNAISSKNQRTSKFVDTKSLRDSGRPTKSDRGHDKVQVHQGGRQEVSSKKRNLVVKWNTGTERDKAAANLVLGQIFRMNRAGTINIVDPISKKVEETNIRNFAKGINLNELGFSIVNVEQVNENTQIPLVKMVDRKTAMKKYADEVARRKREELIGMGVIRKKQTKTNDTEKAEDTIKQIKMSWQIKGDDLTKQKAHEIINQLKRGYKVHLYLDDKNSLNSNNWAANYDDMNLKKLENKNISTKQIEHRMSLIDQLEEIIEDYSVQPIKEGNVHTRMIVKLAPKPVISDQKAKDKLALKEQRKKERQEKLLRRIERKKQAV